MTLFFDLETIPAAPETEDLVREQFERRSRSNSSASQKRETTFEEYLHGTSLDPNFGRILCVGYAIDDQAATTIHPPSPKGSGGASGDPTPPGGFDGASEKTILEKFWDIAQGADHIVGHNAVSFDVPFLWKRSILNGVAPSLKLADPTLIVDTMLLWDMKMPRKHTSLDLLAKLLGIPTSKTTMTGAEVYDYYRAGKLEAIYDYCRRDVEVTRAVYRKIHDRSEAVTKR